MLHSAEIPQGFDTTHGSWHRELTQARVLGQSESKVHSGDCDGTANIKTNTQYHIEPGSDWL